jgi:hypothetical protein
MPRPHLTPGKDPVPIVQGGPQGRSGQVQKMLPPTGIQSPGCPAHRQSLYRLSYPAHKKHNQHLVYIFVIHSVSWEQGAKDSSAMYCSVVLSLHSKIFL